MLIRSGKTIIEEYSYDKIFNGYVTHKEVFTDVLLPLLETVFYSHKDATLIAYGNRNTGIYIYIYIRFN